MKYNDEEDKCYGIAGMTIGITVWSNEDMVYKLDIDDEENGYMLLTSDYYNQNPELSVRQSWEAMQKQFQMTAGMLIANMMCRAIKAGSHSYVDIKNALFPTISEVGKTECQLDDDEISDLFEETYSYMNRVFRNGDVRSLAATLAKELQQKRILSNSEIKELLGIIEKD